MTLRWLTSAGEFFEWLRPAAFILAALASTWVLADARRRGSKLHSATAWAFLSFVFPLIILPLYLAVRLFVKLSTTPEQPNTEPDVQTSSLNNATIEANAGQPPEAANITEDGEADARAVDGTNSVVDEEAASSNRVGFVSRIWARRESWALPLAYLTLLLIVGMLPVVFDYRSVDARLARAEQAKLLLRHERAAREYSAALKVKDDPHTRKLLGLELLRMERWEEALSQLQAAERGGEPDERLPFHIATALDALDRPVESAEYYRKFLTSPVCSQPIPDHRCAKARERFTVAQPDFTQ